MARFKKHVVVYGDTPQLIAEKETGDVSNWIELVQKNDLHYPYIVDTPEEKNKDPHHLVTIGNTIIIPKEDTLADVDTSQIPRYDKLVLEDIILGTDLKVNSVEYRYDEHNTDDEILGLTGNGKGDIGLIKGKDNIVQTLKMRLLTPKGSLPLHPDYGSNIQYLIGKVNNADTAELVANTIQECLEADSRIRMAKLINDVIDSTIYYSYWEVTLQSFDTYFKLAIQRDNDNNFIIM